MLPRQGGVDLHTARGKSAVDHRCWGHRLDHGPGPTALCHAEPLLFLRYDLDLDLDNTLRARESHKVTITGYHSESISPEPKTTKLKLWISFDDGAHWDWVHTKRTDDDTFTATVRHPKLSATTGTVSLRVHATDAAGNTVEQTIERAYGLK